uniref:Uncharacterized protein n=1 Tax=Pseudo-nitzschia australis TaxID=44445 RepID=A0A7S4EIV7_9STRA|mmetsp:Transcript_1469/g.3252  ORF Transcript_1469/g.3252 Transcript_1469/m.3252 type:complete len:503 (-) Transcript_1469:1315-2823(-)|eukprot:CAMPEP_0168178786 /NCGR_PEP_ID=MMETSP0139_2-20121125/9391_1 /TAXON_ID=44445 /ORGANISM="Pseudo-nitzschia australis, Strain 10249 10 AB" /LENGTH=502 /DNA_ID=CAMNT_0008098363 /DNA_START=185 /DNA_END=1693 /DNA_ORIENTATION=+
MASYTLVFSWIAGGIYNLDSHRFQKASLDTRTEGWTETWGNQGDEKSDEETTCEAHERPEKEIMKQIDDKSLSLLLSTPHPQLEIVLTQHRPAWFEQMLMRVAGIPHVVVNSNYISNEATGQLPYLTDCKPSKNPVLVGRNHPSNLKRSSNISNNSILGYLQDFQNVDLDKQAGVTSHQHQALSISFQFMIKSELSQILLHLRFEDSNAWEQVYRDQYIGAAIIQNKEGRGTNSLDKRNWFLKLHGRFQASMERVVERRRLLGYGNSQQNESIDQLLGRANEAYFAIDRQLLSTTKGQNDKDDTQKYLLGTDRPALVDVLLWAHLAEALCDVHLVVALASYPRLVKYFQDMYRFYFCESDAKLDGVCAWKDWNDKQNLENSFQKIPTLSKQNLIESTAFKDAVDLMQKSSLQKQDLQEVLEAVKDVRTRERLPKPRESSSFLLYRWCMGETSKKEQPMTEKEPENPLRKKLLRDQARNDQMWISGIVGVSAIAVLLIQGGAA